MDTNLNLIAMILCHAEIFLSTRTMLSSQVVTTFTMFWIRKALVWNMLTELLKLRKVIPQYNLLIKKCFYHFMSKLSHK